MGMVNTPRDAVCAIVDGREPSVMSLVFSASILCVEAMEFVSWDPVRVTQVIKGKIVKKLIAWIPFVLIMECVFMENAIAIKDGVAPIVKS